MTQYPFHTKIDSKSLLVWQELIEKDGKKHPRITCDSRNYSFNLSAMIGSHFSLKRGQL